MFSFNSQLDTIQEKLNQAKKLQSKGNIERALKEYRSILDIDKTNLAAWHQIAKIAEDREEFASAIEYYQKAIELDPNPPYWVYRHLGFVLYRKEHLDEAIVAYKKAIGLNSDDMDAYKLLGHGLRQQERWEAAIEAYTKALELEPENEEIRRLLEATTAREETDRLDRVGIAKRLQKEGKLKEALSEYRSVLEKDGSNLVALHQIAQICESQGKWDEAVEGYRKAIEVDAEPPFWVYRHLGFALSQQDRLEEAIEAYQRAIDLDSGDAETYSLLGKSFESRGDLQKALSSYHKAVELNPQQSSGFYISLGQSLSCDRRWGEAIEAYNKASQLEPNNPDIYRLLAEAQARQGDLEGAIASCQKSVQFQVDSWKIYHDIGDIFFTLEQWKEATVLYRYSIEVNPDFEWSYYNLGASLDQQGEWVESVVAYQKALDRNPNLPSINEKIEHAIQKTSSKATLSELEQSKRFLENLNSVYFENFLITESRLYFPKIEHPDVSIILVLYNRAELTLSCLESILKNSFKSIEIIIVDNGSTDLTRTLLKQISGANIIFNEENLHFLLACNQASKVAKGDYLLFLNNDAQILGDSITVAVETLKSSSNIGAVGGKIILPDGTLQEAGSIIWQDGSCLGYGRGDSPTAPQYMFKRSVDYCSGAFLLTPRRLFLELGGFDEDYQPAYYEETDYCVRLLRLGKKIVYDPRIAILHYEFASSHSSSSSGKAIELQKRNQSLFLEKHKTWFSLQYQPAAHNIIFSRTDRGNGKRILFLEDKVPHTFLGSGYTRGNSILSTMVEMGFFITLYPTDLLDKEDWAMVYSDISCEVEVMNGYLLPHLEKFLQERKGYYDIVFVSRPHNMLHLEQVLKQDNFLEGAKIIYDAEALYCLRDFELRRLQGETLSEDYKQAEIEKELNLAKRSDCIISVSENERSKFIEYGYQEVSVLGHSVALCPTPRSFGERQDFLFVGAIYGIESPNADSVLWLGEEIFKKIQAKLEEKVNLLIAGTNRVEELNRKVEKFRNSSIQMLGRVEDLTDLYNRSRVFVVPTRFASGIPHKAHEAAARGIPMVVTSLIAEQLGWKNEVDLLVADTAEEFARQCVRLYTDIDLWSQIREAALNKVQRDCSPYRFAKTLSDILKKI